MSLRKGNIVLLRKKEDVLNNGPAGHGIAESMYKHFGQFVTIHKDMMSGKEFFYIREDDQRFTWTTGWIEKKMEILNDKDFEI